MTDKSPARAMTRALERTRQALFPVHFEKWLALGFIAFLAGLGDGGSPYTMSWPFNGKRFGTSGSSKSATDEPDLAQLFRETVAWVQDHLPLVIGLAGLALLIGVGVGLLLLWLSSWGKLMFVESVIHDRYRVKEPWARLRAPAWAVFKFRALLTLISLLLAFCALGAGLAMAFEELRTGAFGGKTIAGAVVAVGIAVLTFLPLWLVSLLLEDFVLPVYYLRGGTLSDAWATVRREVVAGNAGALCLFYALKMLLSGGFAIFAMLTACLTCCVAALPYLSSVALLPAYLFFRSYSLYFLEELGLSVFPQPPAFAYPP